MNFLELGDMPYITAFGSPSNVTKRLYESSKSGLPFDAEEVHNELLDYSAYQKVIVPMYDGEYAKNGLLTTTLWLYV